LFFPINNAYIFAFIDDFPFLESHSAFGAEYLQKLRRLRDVALLACVDEECLLLDEFNVVADEVDE
jgi:hypothetical protein